MRNFQSPAWRTLLAAVGLVALASCRGSEPTGTPPPFETRLPPAGQNNLWYDVNGSDTVVVFVHGIFSDSRGCWWYQDRDDRAKNRYWPELIRTDRSLGSPSIFLAGYPADIDSGIETVRDAAAIVRQALAVGVDGHPPVMSKKNILFIAHSTGGIVVRYLLERYGDAFKDKTIGLMLMASPSDGSDLADYLSGLADLYRNELAKELQVSSQTLVDLDDRFKEFLYRHSLPHLVGVEAFEHHFIVHRRWWPDTMRVVERQSAGRYFGAARLLPDTDHFGTVKPPSTSHPAHRLLLEFFKGDFVSAAARRDTERARPIVNSREVIQVTANNAAQYAALGDLSADQIVVSDAILNLRQGALIKANEVRLAGTAALAGSNFVVMTDRLVGGVLSADGRDGSQGEPGQNGGQIVIYSATIAGTLISARGGSGGPARAGMAPPPGGAGGEILVITSGPLAPPPDVTGGIGGTSRGVDGRVKIARNEGVSSIRNAAATGATTDQLVTSIRASANADLSNRFAVASEQVAFPAGSATLNAEAQAGLERLAVQLSSEGTWVVTVQPSGDTGESPESNFLLQADRETTVRRFLAGRGIAPARLRSVTGSGNATASLAEGTKVVVTDGSAVQ